MNWIKSFNLEGRREPDLFLTNSNYSGMPYASEMQTAMHNLNLDGFFCVQNIPVVTFIQVEAFDPVQVANIHKSLWNLGLADLLLVMSPDTVYAISLVQSPSEEPVAVDHDTRLIETLDILADTLKLKEIIPGVESGRWINDNKAYFSKQERIDNKLLSNLTSTRNNLTSKCNMRVDSAQTLIMQIMFIAYLEDREILVPQYFSDACNSKSIAGLHKLLAQGEPKLLKALFERLNEDFNGSLFKSIGGFSENEAINIPKECLTILFEFRDGRIDMKSGQTSFWPYEFNYIPVELVSAVYDRFLASDASQQRENGEYYTPLLLAELVVSQAWDTLPKGNSSNSDFSVFDPACGSGIFLVRVFQRLVSEWREAHGNRRPSWRTLTNIIKRVHGHDINSGAINVTLFSLYVTMLEQVKPSDIQVLMSQGHLLPVLLGDTLKTVDYFSEEPLSKQHDLIIGNPPWVSRKREASLLATAWANENNRHLPGNEIAWAFTWKSISHIKDCGIVSFILPGMSYLANHQKKTLEARSAFFNEIQLHEIINLADTRFLLFENARRPAAVITYGKKTKATDNYRFNYYVPKGDLNIVNSNVLTISPYDKGSLRSQDIINNPYIFRQWMWMSGSESRLHGWLNSQHKLKESAVSFDKSKSMSEKELENIMICGQGFQPAKQDRMKNGDYTAKFSSLLDKASYLNSKLLTPYIVEKSTLEKPKRVGYRRIGFEEGYSGKRVLISRGIKAHTGRNVAAYTESPISFQDTVYALKGKDSHSEELKFLTVLLNSTLAGWWFFHTTASAGMDRPEVHTDDILNIPFWTPEEADDPSESKQIWNKIITKFNAIHESRNQFTLLSSDDPHIDEFDNLIFKYYGLSDLEIDIVKESVSLVFPSVQPKRNSRTTPPLWKLTNENEWIEYANTLKACLKDWLHEGNTLDIQPVDSSLDMVILRLDVNGEKIKHNQSSPSYSDVLRKVYESLPTTCSGNIKLIPHLRIEIEGSLYIIKPRTKRFWLKAMAVSDADSLIAELSKVRLSN